MKPSEEYTIHILSNEDFDALPVGNPKDALGMTDAKRKIAWVRQTGVKDLDQGTINHEFDELMAKTSHHEIDGIRYKGAGKIFKNIALTALAVFGGPPGFAASLGIGLTDARSKRGSARSAARRQIKEQETKFKQNQLSNTNPFAPSSGQGPLSETQFNKGLGNIGDNLQKRETSLTRKEGFRGQGSATNTALSNSLNQAKTSTQLTRDDFIGQQDNAKRELSDFNVAQGERKTALDAFNKKNAAFL